MDVYIIDEVVVYDTLMEDVVYHVGLFYTLLSSAFLLRFGV